ncbi:MAG: glutamate racemase [Candidatus Paceibacterota bacterium]|jgi:glutamate racemase
MKIGIFDSGIGGLLITKAIYKKLPKYDYVYLGDTKRVPYGNRSHESIYEFTKEAVEYLFNKENCAIVILACNTASARALRKLQKNYLPKKYPNRRILGVLIPTAEEVQSKREKGDRVGILATRGTVISKSYVKEIRKINKKIKVFQTPAPMLVPLIEEGEKSLIKPFLKKYLFNFIKKDINVLVLGCTHYPILKNEIKKILKESIEKKRKGDENKDIIKQPKIISQDEIIPSKLERYLFNHPEIEKKLSKKSRCKILVTDLTKSTEKLTKLWFKNNVKPKLIDLHS